MKGGRGKGEKREDAAENRHAGQTGGRSNKQRLYNLEHDQADNLANAERLRNDLQDLTAKVAMRNEVALRSEMYELTTKYIKLAQIVYELLQDKHKKEGTATREVQEECAREVQEKNTSGEQAAGERRRREEGCFNCL